MKPSSKHVSKEIITIVFTIVLTIIVTILTTISGAGFDISQLSATEVYTNIILNTIIVLLVTVVAYPYGKVNTMCKKNPDGSNGRYITAYLNFNTAYAWVKHKLHQFSQWHNKKYNEEVYEKQVRYLSEKGVKQIPLILKLDRTQILSLTTAQEFKIDGETVFVSSLTKKQIKACLKVYDGKITLHKLPDYYFLYVDGKSSSSFYEQAYYERRLENAYVIGNILAKVLFGLIISCVLTSLIIDSMVFDSLTMLKIFTNLTSRILTIGTSLHGGYSIGQNLIYKKCYYIDGKSQILTEFSDDKEFVYQDPQILAKQEYLAERSESNEEQVDILE